jgi:hypothetical protein
MYGLTPYTPKKDWSHAYLVDPVVFPLPVRSDWRFVSYSDRTGTERRASAIGFRMVGRIMVPWHVISESDKAAIKAVALAMGASEYGHPEACPWEAMRENFGLVGTVYEKAEFQLVLQARFFGANNCYWPQRSGEFLSAHNGAIMPHYFDPTWRIGAPDWTSQLATEQSYGKTILSPWAIGQNWELIRANTIAQWR